MGLRVVVAEESLLMQQGTTAALALEDDIEFVAECGDYDGPRPRNPSAIDRLDGLRRAPRSQIEVECERDGSDDSVYNCSLTYSNALHEAVDAEPVVREWSGRVEEGRIEILGFDNSASPVEASWLQWAAETGLADHPCDQSQPPTPDCFRFQLEHIDEWAVWHSEQLGS